jgi:hypothetical protein
MGFRVRIDPEVGRDNNEEQGEDRRQSYMSRLRVVVSAAAVLALAAGLAAALTVTAHPRPNLVSIGPTAAPSTAGYRITDASQLGQITLNDVSCTSPTACTMVGYSTAHHRDAPLAARWNGRNWTMQPTPAPPDGGQLLAVSCTSATACTAAGEAYRKPVPDSNAYQPLAESWNGSRWAVQPAVIPVKFASLSDVSCTSRSACLALVTFEGNSQTLMERWGGRAWVLLGTPPGSMAEVSCVAAASCVAAGSDQQQDFGIWSQDWDGSTWAMQATPRTERGGDGGETVDAVSCASPAACMAVGSDYYNSYHLTAERWDGTRWVDQLRLRTPGPATNPGLNDVSCPTATFCMAVGSITDAQDRDHTVPGNGAVRAGPSCLPGTFPGRTPAWPVCPARQPRSAWR